MKWRPIVFTAPEPNDVLRQLESIGVKIALDVTTAIKMIDKFLQQYKKCFWAVMMFEISAAIREELLKSRNVNDVDLVRQVVDYLEKDEGLEDKEAEEEDEEAEGSDEEEKKEGSGSNLDSEEDEDSDDDVEDEDGSVSSEEGSDSDSEDDVEDEDGSVSSEEGSDSDSEDDVEVVVEANEEEEEEEIDEFKDPTRKVKCMEDLKLVCRRMGFVLKQGDEAEILDMMIPYVRGCPMYRDGISIFLKRVREHIYRCSALNDLKTVEAALNSSIFRQEYEDWKK